MENFELKSMTDFVQMKSTEMYAKVEAKDGKSQNAVFQFINEVPNYANFLKQENAIWMFIPCDESGNILPKPEMREEKDSFGEKDVDFDVEELHQYIKAKERCLFIIDDYEIADDVVYFYDKSFMISKDTATVFWKDQTFKSIEELANNSVVQFTLSPAATKKIGL